MNADTVRSPADPFATVPRRALVGRAAVLLLLLLRGAVALAGQTAVGVLRRDLRTRRDRWLVDLVTRLGPAFIKAAQLLATRADVLPPRLCAAFARLYDGVRPAPLTTEAAELRDTGLVLDRGADGIARPVAAGSIACVYRATAPDGRRVAVKVRRPGVARQLAVDLELMRRGTRLMARLPQLRGLPAVAVVDQMTEAVHGQLDFQREARFLAEFRRNMAEESGLRVPAVHRDLGHDDVLVMEFMEGLRRRAPHEFPEEVRERAVLSTLRGIYRMLFIDGLVHCDLHPGNLYFLPDGDVVLVDAGFTVRLDERTRAAFAWFFLQMHVGDGEACAEIVLTTATPGPRADTDGFTRELAALVRANSGAVAADFDLVTFGASLFDIQRRHDLYAAPEFVFPLLSLLVLEGTVRAFAPQVDFQKEAGPYLMKSVFGEAFQPAA
ncbi:AarF/UbiB family protein [Streptomyces sp. NPDC002589]|uniref:ABC1 kinase family protein n=1 Tax=Streptomyces sp. NPDC002589 TaxID=3154420 RepID=UPI0033302FB5